MIERDDLLGMREVLLRIQEDLNLAKRGSECNLAIMARQCSSRSSFATYSLVTGLLATHFRSADTNFNSAYIRQPVARRIVLQSLAKVNQMLNAQKAVEEMRNLSALFCFHSDSRGRASGLLSLTADLLDPKAVEEPQPWKPPTQEGAS